MTTTPTPAAEYAAELRAERLADVKAELAADWADAHAEPNISDDDTEQLTLEV